MIKYKGELGFHEYFKNIYQDRWSKIFESFLTTKKVARINKFSGFKADHFKIFDQLSYLNEYMNPEFTSCGLKNIYPMALSSFLPPLSLPLENDSQILDMCAAPGGKSLILAEQMGESFLTLNEPSAPRRTRLKNVVSEYLPNEILQRISFLSEDGSLMFRKRKSSFDRILLDAPCSSESHWVEKKMLSEWSLKRSQGLAIKQYAILASAWECLMENGFIVYSTCSINPLENDEVIKKLLSRKPEAKVLSLSFSIGSKTEFGWMVLPDEGYDPIYCSLIQKTN